MRIRSSTALSRCTADAAAIVCCHFCDTPPVVGCLRDQSAGLSDASRCLCQLESSIRCFDAPGLVPARCFVHHNLRKQQAAAAHLTPFANQSTDNLGSSSSSSQPRTSSHATLRAVTWCTAVDPCSHVQQGGPRGPDLSPVCATMGQAKSKTELARTVKHHTEFSWWALHKYVLPECVCARACNANRLGLWSRTSLYGTRVWSVAHTAGTLPSVGGALKRMQVICADQQTNSAVPEWQRWQITRSQFRDGFTGTCIPFPPSGKRGSPCCVLRVLVRAHRLHNDPWRYVSVPSSRRIFHFQGVRDCSHRERPRDSAGPRVLLQVPVSGCVAGVRVPAIRYR